MSLTVTPFMGVVTQQKITEWEITKTKVGNEKDIFIKIIKYITHERCEESSGDYLIYFPICRTSHQADEFDTRTFYGGSVCRAVDQTCPMAPKMPWAPSAFQLKWVPQRPGDKPSPCQGGWEPLDVNAEITQHPRQAAWTEWTTTTEGS